MDEMTEKFAGYCEQVFDLSKALGYPYKSLSICIIDCVYSLRAKYETVTKPVVQRYADEFMHHNLSFENDTVSNLVENISRLETLSIKITEKILYVIVSCVKTCRKERPIKEFISTKNHNLQFRNKEERILLNNDHL